MTDTDPRVQAVAEALAYHPGNRGGSIEQREQVFAVLAPVAIKAADAADRAAGYVRVRTDDATVEKVARAMVVAAEGWDDPASWTDLAESSRSSYRRDARAVLEALVTP